MMRIDEIENRVAELYGFSGKAKSLYGDVDLNYHFLSENGFEYVLKLTLEVDAADNLIFQHAMADHLVNAGLHLPAAIKDVNCNTVNTVEFEDRSYLMSLLSWIPGRLWSNYSPQTDIMLQGLGGMLGQMSRALSSFDHPGAYRTMSWDNASAEWIGNHLTLFPTGKKEIIEYFMEQYISCRIQRGALRKSIIHGDANDNNVILTDDLAAPQVRSIIDYGDALHSYTINELANALAYVMMDQREPNRVACQLIRSYHQQFSLEESEIELLPLMIATRLMISVTHSSINYQKDPANQYHQISAEGAWRLLEWLQEKDTQQLVAEFRHACGWDPTGKRMAYEKWLQKSRKSIQPIVAGFNKENSIRLDLSVASPLLGHYSNYTSTTKFGNLINDHLAKTAARWGIGQYSEVRPIYTTDTFTEVGDEGPQWRTVHLGLDVFGVQGTVVSAPLSGVVHSCADNGMNLDYGPTVILKHEVEELVFYTLYGHLSHTDLELLESGTQVKAGDIIGHFGGTDENGGWPPHLHFQIILDLFENEKNYPGVCSFYQQNFWCDVCPDPSEWLGLEKEKSNRELEGSSILHQRKKVLGRSLSISYSEPLHMVRGMGQYLMDSTGRRYLDMVNNVAHVGHEHPRVVEAGQRQMGLLNTNTRYLHEELVAFAEELTATLPASLNVCHFVNSGSEANELALRMAKVATGRKDFIAVAHGYHGNTQECINVSSYKFDSRGGEGKPDHVHLLGIPDAYRGPYRGETAASQYAAQVDGLIAEMSKQNRPPAALICESILSCGGQVPLPESYLKQVYASVRLAGGVCIADEVQVGVGRVGEYYWGFELSDVVPDIVTIGKPLGNGHPVAAVVITSEIADAFNNGMEFFNTFGGNPVSCAIGRSVLGVVEEEGLQQHALEMGEHLRKGLLNLQNQYPLIGDVRGVGLFQGFELVKDRESLEPAADQASYLANRMRIKGVLLSTDGPLHNVIKIKPPMVIQRSDIDMAIELMDEVFAETVMREPVGS